ncbi:MAG: Na/Pi cotransporter family protein [Alphaproteobacteria bacterium]|nr:Na/Pi cotransporter family protein [Alphaproteobacteria bacterium]
MGEIDIAVAVAAAVVLFLFGIEHFSAEIQSISGQRFRQFLARGTNNRFAGFGLGAAVTAVIQSSTATSVIAVGLVNAGVLTFRQSLGVLFGANVGTTVTAQLVALKLTSFAPWLILVGFVAGLLPFRWKIFGKSIFYFGIVFFSLELVSSAVEPLKEHPALLSAMASLDSVWMGILVGAVFTALVQSSSVTTGVAIVLMSQGALQLEAAIPLILGANIGTTSTALLASAQLDTSARRTSLSHALYNVIGVVLFLPLLPLLGRGLEAAGLSGAPALAMAHLVFNLSAAALFLALLEPFARLVERLVPDDNIEVEPIPGLTPEVFLAGEVGGDGHRAVLHWAQHVVLAQRDAYVAAVLAIETRDRAIDSRSRRTSALVDYALEEAAHLTRRVSGGEISEPLSEAVLRFVVTVDHLRQMQDSIGDLQAISTRLDREHGRLSIDSLLEVQLVYPVFAKGMEQLGDYLGTVDPAALEALDVADDEAQVLLQEAYRRFLVLVRKRNESGELADFLSIHQRLRTKIAAFTTYLESGVAVPTPAPRPSRTTAPQP